MSRKLEIIESNKSATPSKWREKAEWRRNNREWIRKSQRIAMTILNWMEENNISQKELAESLGVSPQYISKLLKGSENLSLETITKLENVTNIEFIRQNSYVSTQRLDISWNKNNYPFSEIGIKQSISFPIKNDYNLKDEGVNKYSA